MIYKKKAVSIIVPAYNVQNQIERCLNSLISQTLTNIEIIVVNDGSIDQTQIIVERFLRKDNRIRLINKENGGVTSARICGINAATGQYIGFADGDDIVKPNMFETLYKNAINNNADISHCGYVMEYPSGKKEYYYNTKKTIIQNNCSGLIDLISGSFIEPALVNKIYKRELFDGVLENIDRSIKNTEDLLLNFWLFKKSNISIYEDRCLYRYMLRKNSATSSGAKLSVLKDSYKVLKVIYDNTNDSTMIQKVAKKRLLDVMVKMACQENKDDDLIIKIHKELKNRKYDILKSNLPLITKVKVLIVSISPKLYRRIHEKYLDVTGIGKKYNLEN